MRILVVDDDRTIATLLKRLLTAEGHDVDCAERADDAFASASTGGYDAIVLDLTLGDQDGRSLLAQLRAAGCVAPVLVLTGDVSEEALVGALDAGADEFVTKPIGGRELAARIRALVRRGPAGNQSNHVRVGNVRLDRRSHTVTVSDVALPMSPREFATLEQLMLHAGEFVTRDQLLQTVWGMTFDPGTNVVEVHLARVRRRLATRNAGVSIENERGVGWRLLPGH